MSTLPVRSPLPKSVPSTLSAPAISASSVAATPSPLSLWGCSEIIAQSRFLMWRQKYSIWSAYPFGVEHSTVEGRLRIIGFSGVGCITFITSSQIQTELSISVPVKLSGEYSYLIFISGLRFNSSSVSCLISFAPLTAISITPSMSVLKTTLR